jgi:hypothetical protein
LSEFQRAPIKPLIELKDLEKIDIRVGRISEGMLFDVGYADGLTPVLAVPEKEIAEGARAG